MSSNMEPRAYTPPTKCRKATRPARVFIALGSNQGDRLDHLLHGLKGLGELTNVELHALSSIFESEPAYYSEQDPFANAVLELHTTLDPHALLTELQRLELEEGRVRTFPNAPRPLDLDILDYEGVCLSEEVLTLPHPRVLERDFVVTPLLEIAPQHTLASGTVVTRERIAYGMVTRVLGKLELPLCNVLPKKRSNLAHFSESLQNPLPKS